MTKEQKDMPRTDVGKEGGMPRHDDGGKLGGDYGKQGGDKGEKKEWEKKEWEKPSEPEKKPSV